MPSARSAVRTAVLTCGALTCFACNSVLSREALGNGSIDAATFSAVRLLSGAAMMLALVWLQSPRKRPAIGGRWTAAVVMVLYAIPFSFAFNSLSAGTGALILFGTVQVTMVLAALAAGERPHRLEWLGLFVAVGGLMYLVSGGLETPSIAGALLMSLAGVCWGLYTLLGRGSEQPLLDTAGNFVRTVPLVVWFLFLTPEVDPPALTTRGLLLAMVCGAITSGVGYAIWYAALRGLTATRAATVQLAVPVLAALAGVLFQGEVISLQKAVSAVLILGGIGVAIAGRAAVKSRLPVPLSDDASR